MNNIVLGKGQLLVFFCCTRFVTDHLEKLVNALFPQGVSTFLQLVVAWLYLILERKKCIFFSFRYFAVHYNFNIVPQQVTGAWEDFNSLASNFLKGCKW